MNPAGADHLLLSLPFAIVEYFQMIRVGVLSDTHLNTPSAQFCRQVQETFRDCSVILHAGDLTDFSILKAFADKEVYAVHGNMCSSSAQEQLPTEMTIKLGGFSIGLCHGANGARHTIEDRMWDLFPTADCIVYGHTHIPVCHRLAKTLFVNPGSFTGTGRYGAAGTYAIMSIDQNGISADLYQLEEFSR